MYVVLHESLVLLYVLTCTRLDGGYPSTSGCRPGSRTGGHQRRSAHLSCWSSGTQQASCIFPFPWADGCWEGASENDNTFVFLSD